MKSHKKLLAFIFFFTILFSIYPLADVTSKEKQVFTGEKFEIELNIKTEKELQFLKEIGLDCPGLGICTCQADTSQLISLKKANYPFRPPGKSHPAEPDKGITQTRIFKVKLDIKNETELSFIKSLGLDCKRIGECMAEVKIEKMNQLRQSGIAFLDIKEGLRIEGTSPAAEAEKPVQDTPKGQTSLPQKRPAKIKIKKTSAPPILDRDKDKKDNPTSKSEQTFKSAGWVTIMSEDFESYFPRTGWQVFDNNGSANGQYYWDDDDFKPWSGYWSAWCANGGANELDPQYNNYPDSCDSWMTYGPFSLQDADDAELTCYWWLDSESGYDEFYIMASIDDSIYYGYPYSGYWGGFWYEVFDLTTVDYLGNLCGEDSVWIAFIFESDGSVNYQGAFVDDILLQKNVVTKPDLVIKRMTPSNTNPLIGEYINVEMVIKNQGTDYAGSSYTGLFYNLSSPPDIYTWEDTFKWVGEVAAHDSVLITFTGVTSADTATWNMYCLADCDGYVDESNEDNNYIGPKRVKWWGTSPKPDLIVEDVMVSGYCPYIDESLYVDVTITNQGGTEAHYFVTDFYYNRATPPDTGYECNGDDCWPSSWLYPGEKETFTFLVNNNPTFGTTWSMWLLIDAGNRITESNEGNNVYGPIEIGWMEPSAFKAASITRDQIINNGMAFTLKEWVCPSINATPPKACPEWRSDYIVDSTYWGVAYEWGGCDDTAQFRCNLDKGQRAGALTGAIDFCPLPPAPPEGGRGGYPWATGIDCCGLVWQSLEAGYHTTKDLNDVGYWLSGGAEYLLKGDYLLIYDKHTFLFDSWAEGDTLMYVIEAGDFRDKDPDHSSEARWWTRGISFYTQYNAYKYINVQATPGYDPGRAGDANSDGKVDAVDITYLINYLFKMSNIRPHPNWRGDTNGDCKVSVGDVVYLINYLYKGGPMLHYCSDCPSRTCYYYP